MKKTYSVLMLLLLSESFFAQDIFAPEFGKISQEEIDMKTCPFDESANAVVLFDTGKTIFFQKHGNYDIRFYRHKRIKILSDQGVENGEISIPYYVNENGKEEKIKSIKAYTYIHVNDEIKKHPLDPSTIYTERINKWWKQKKFVFPNLKKGAIVEYSYLHETPFLFNLPDWEFQSIIPTQYSQYQISMIPFYEYVSMAQGIDSFSHQNTVESELKYSFGNIRYKELLYTYGMENIDAFKDESYITSRNDYIKKIDFQLSKIHDLNGTSREIIPTWVKLNQDLLGHKQFGKFIRECRRFAKITLEKINTSNQTGDKLIEILVKHVKESFHWDGYNSKYASQTAKEFYNKKSGNAADINLFLLALLREAGVDAEPMILSTRDNGKLTALYPIAKQFNYVLVYVTNGDFTFITDGTSPLTDYLTIPTRCINDYGLIVEKGKESFWSRIQYNYPSSNHSKVAIKINPGEKKCDIAVSVDTNFFEAYGYRYGFENDTLKIKENFENNFDRVFDVKTLNYNRPELPYSIRFKAESELAWINNYLLLQPFFHLPLTENQLKQEKRDYPVDMLYPKHYSYDINLQIPENYEIEKIPESLSYEDELVSIKFNTKINAHDNHLRILGEYTFKKAVYAPENYTLLKSHIDSIIDNFNPELVLKEKL